MSAEPLEPEVEALLDAERRAAPPGQALDRVWSRLATGLPIATPRSTPGPRNAQLASHTASVALAAFVAGGVAGSLIYAAIQKPPPDRVVYVDRPAPSASVAAETQPSPSSPPSAARALPPPTPARATDTPATSPSADSLAEERAMLDRARLDLTSGRAAEALKLLDGHAQRFKKPQLAEEREALAIQSLVTLGRSDEARARAARFLAASPDSLFVPAIEAALGSIP